MSFSEYLGMFKDYEQQSNLGYFQRVAILDEDKFLIDEAGNMNVLPDAFFEDLYFANKQANFTIEDAETKFGKFFSYVISCKIPKVSKDFIDFFRLYAEKRWIVLAEDFNGQTHIIGATNDGCNASIVAGIDSLSYVNVNFSYASGDLSECLSDFNIDNIKNMANSIDLREYDVRDIYAVRGDTFLLEMNFYALNGTVENLGGNTFLCKVKNTADTDILTFGMGTGFTLANVNTKLVMSKTATEMNIAAGSYVYDIQRTGSGGSPVKTVLKGKFIIESDIS
jgi:hypothetical protein